MKNLVSVKWLSEHLYDDQLVIVDCQFVLGDAEVGYQTYLEGHIPGAVYADLEKDLSSEPGEHGGRHPLPDQEQLQDLIERLGIDPDSKVIAYDSQYGAMASRLWWLLGFAGHKQRAVLDGGLEAWRGEGLKLETKVPTPNKTHYPISLDKSMIVSVNDVKKAQAEGRTIIDSRAPERYAGDVEPIDAKPGHIPEAVNYFWKNNLTEDQKWKDPGERVGVDSGEEPIVYCGSGVTACVNLLAFQEAGVHAKLYPGSYSDWISYNENEVKSK
ncbi:sulfurtransferase [Pseudalkalibacillus hwajinpoensis]|uniref:sulfurtransferase n=1 Tax=Guptibacillus hwajinpoensis TaxID=208199 RepID=UPI00325BF9F5